MLPRDSFLTELIVWHNHSKCMHLGTPSTLNRIRTSGYWITKGRATVKSILAKCITCKKINSLAFKYPKPTDYYGDKVNIIKPFYNTGIDFTGHFNVKLGDKIQKMYILVFTCLNVRAIHLELLPDMSCAQFLLAFVRFGTCVLGFWWKVLTNL